MNESAGGGMDAAGARPSAAPHPSAGIGGLSATREPLGAAALSAVLDELPFGVYAVEADGGLRYANATARLQLLARDGLQLRRGVLSASTPADTPLLRDLIAICGATPAAARVRQRRGPALALERARGRPLLVVAKALQPAESEAAIILLFVSDPDREAPPSAPLLGTLFGLSPAEVKLTLALLHGHGLQAAARAAGITLGTAHTHLRHIFSKTGTSRQAELVHLILAIHVHGARDAAPEARRNMQ